MRGSTEGAISRSAASGVRPSALAPIQRTTAAEASDTGCLRVRRARHLATSRLTAPNCVAYSGAEALKDIGALAWDDMSTDSDRPQLWPLYGYFRPVEEGSGIAQPVGMALQ